MNVLLTIVLLFASQFSSTAYQAAVEMNPEYLPAVQMTAEEVILDAFGQIVSSDYFETKALETAQTAFDEAESNLEAAQTAFDEADDAQDKDDAQAELTAAQTAFDEAESNLEAAQTAFDEAGGKTAPVVEDDDEAAPVVEINGDVLTTDWFSANIPAEVTAQKENPDGCEFPGDAGCNVVHDSGVLGCDFLADANANDSCVWTGGADHQRSQVETVGTIVPEGSYLTAYASSFTVSGGGYEIVIPDCGELCAQGFLARGLNAEDGKDLNTSVDISDHGAIGAMTYTTYTVPVYAAQYFSFDYVTDQAINAINTNCGAGPDCEEFRQHIFDYNDSSYTVYRFTAADGWEELFSNIVEKN